MPLPAAHAAAGSRHASAAAPSADELLVQAREAARKRDTQRVAQLRRQLGADHPLALWVDYWDLTNRLGELQQADLDAFYARWPGSYVEDRLRNDWLLELGRRRAWDHVRAEFPRFRMNDDREVTCYWLLTQHLDGHDVRAAAKAAWYAQRETDDGCHLLAAALSEAKQLTSAEVWAKVWLAADANRPRAARLAAGLLGLAPAKGVVDAFEQPTKTLKRGTETPREVAVVALMRLAANDDEAAANELESSLARRLTPEQAALAWATVGRNAAQRLATNAAEHYQRAWKAQREAGQPPQWSTATLAWGARAALRSARVDRERWGVVAQSVDAMAAAEQADPAWRYWRARATQGLAKTGPAGDADREAARSQLVALASTIGFYGHLAAHDVGLKPALPAAPAPLTDAELAAARALPGLGRGLQLAQLGLRDEGRREWNYTLRGMSDRELIAAAQVACNAEDWQLCINTSERTREQIDVRQRYPMPFVDTIKARAADHALDPAFVFGLIRQETRFMPQLRSHAGASGLMQLMPATARWTARKIGLDFKPEQITDIETNLKLGTTYLKVVLEDFAGSQSLAAAAYNAGPGRPRRWREGPVLDAAAWAENIPFDETRDYVKRVLANAVVYSALLGIETAATLKQRLGAVIGPREARAAPPDRDIP